MTQRDHVSIANMLSLAVEAEEMRRSLKHFVVGAWSLVEPAPFVDGWCLDAIVEHLEAVTRDQIRFLLINIPPRHSKSTIGSVLWPVWGWLQRPDERFLCASYSLELSTRDNLRKRSLIESPWFQDRYGQDVAVMSDAQAIELVRSRDFTLSKEQNAKRFFMNDKLGIQMATSVASSATGHGGSVLLIDDPHAADEAYSDADREAANRWFRETWSNRLNDANKDKMITIGQRIHEEDVSGLILSERPDWVHLNLPASYEPARKCYTSIGWQDPREDEGELLWPERFNEETLARYKRDMGSIGFAAQYQQSPVPTGGAVFRKDWFRYFTETDTAYVLEGPNGTRSVLKGQCRTFGTGDLAISSRETADYTVFALWAVTPERDLILLDVYRDHLDNPAQLKLLRLLHSRYFVSYFKIESVAYQLALVQQALAEGIPCRSYNPAGRGDKVARASAPAIWMENGKIFFRANAAYLDDLEPELLFFPMGAHDDQVDNLSMAADDVVEPTGAFMWSPDDIDTTKPSPETLPNDTREYAMVMLEGWRKDIDEDEGYTEEVQW